LLLLLLLLLLCLCLLGCWCTLRLLLLLLPAGVQAAQSAGTSSDTSQGEAHGWQGACNRLLHMTNVLDRYS
jgi:hypothetical protein